MFIDSDVYTKSAQLSLAEALQSVSDQWEKELLHNFRLDISASAQETEILETCNSHSLVIGSDGSVLKNNAGAFAWVMATEQGVRLGRNCGIVRGRRVTSYRAEAVGILSVLRTLQKIREFEENSWEDKVIKVVCDNEALVKKLIIPTGGKVRPIAI